MHNFTNEGLQTASKSEIRRSTISGQGKFARRKIAVGEFIIALSGLVVHTDPNVDSICAEFGVSGDDPLQIGDELFLILNHESKTINHSCHPNAGLVYFYSYVL